MEAQLWLHRLGRLSVSVSRLSRADGVNQTVRYDCCEVQRHLRPESSPLRQRKSGTFLQASSKLSMSECVEEKRQCVRVSMTSIDSDRSMLQHDHTRKETLLVRSSRCHPEWVRQNWNDNTRSKKSQAAQKETCCDSLGWIPIICDRASREPTNSLTVLLPYRSRRPVKRMRRLVRKRTKCFRAVTHGPTRSRRCTCSQ